MTWEMLTAQKKVKLKPHTSDMQTECAWHSEIIFLSLSFDIQIYAFLWGKYVGEGEIFRSYIFV